MKLISTNICKTSDIGVNDNLFGGTMLSWLDEAGGIMASCVCRSNNVITLKMEEVLFKKPVKVKDLVRIYCRVDHVGNTSVSLSLEARTVNLIKTTEDLVCSTCVVYVHVDEDGRPKSINKTN
ncbi:MAG: acyl-CoA thioesterase [Bacteroidetes bacterium]|nr:acyl-CoA thioesterase [Bacteroidota bacterium]MBL6944473.1 acyl-CoA thioesterase [Bacteroidales bacterium]